MSLADMMTEDCKKDLLIVGAMSNLLDKVNVAVLWALSTEVLCPAKEDQLTRFLSTSLIRSLIAVAVRECLSAYAFKMCSLPVITSAASLSKAGRNPLCPNIVSDIGYDIAYDIGYDIGYCQGYSGHNMI